MPPANIHVVMGDRVGTGGLGALMTSNFRLSQDSSPPSCCLSGISDGEGEGDDDDDDDGGEGADVIVQDTWNWVFYVLWPEYC